MRRLMDLGVVLVLAVTVVYSLRLLKQGPQEEPKREKETSEAIPARELSPEHKRILAEQEGEARRKEELRLEALERQESDRKKEEEFWAEVRRQEEEERQRRAEPLDRRPWYQKPLVPEDWGRPGGASSTEASGNDSLEARRNEARSELEANLSSLSREARTLIAAAQAYQRSCGELEPAGNCEGMLRQVGRQAIVVGRDLHAAQELARISWISPGEMRALREKYGLGDTIWDQLVTIVNTYAR